MFLDKMANLSKISMNVSHKNKRYNTIQYEKMYFKVTTPGQ